MEFNILRIKWSPSPSKRLKIAWNATTWKLFFGVWRMKIPLSWSLLNWSEVSVCLKEWWTVELLRLFVSSRKTITTKIWESFLHHYVLFAWDSCCACREWLWLGRRDCAELLDKEMKLIGSMFLYIWWFLDHSCSIWEI